MKQWTGIAASSGIVSGPLWVYHPVKVDVVRRQIVEPGAEWERLQAGVTTTLDKIAYLEQEATQQVGEKEAAIFAAHAMFLKDPEFLEIIEQGIFKSRLNAEAAVEDAAAGFEKMMLELDDDYFRERAQDIRDVAGQLIATLAGKGSGAKGPAHPAIVVAEELTPSDTIQFDKAFLLGLVTRKGGPTAHTVILARSLGIPAAVSVPFPLGEMVNGTTAILNGTSGTLTVDPDPEVIAQAEMAQQILQQAAVAALEEGHQPTVTLDGVQVEISANIGSVEDAVRAVTFGAEGVGLFRTEFVYMDAQSVPSEESQVQIYRQVFEVMAPRPVVVRTVDIGGDKDIPYLGLTREENPFLGWRGIRMLSGRPDLVEGQLRALLLAGTQVDLRIMFPMVSSLEEIESARRLFDQVKAQLAREQRPVAGKVQFGIMVEVPSIALVARQAAHLVDFFSIGTNDLTQYTLAVDRGNERVAQLASPYHPAVLQLIHRTIEAGHAAGKWVGMCGEFAGDPLAAPLLLGLGLDEFSASAPLLPALKQVIRRCRVSECRTLAAEALQQGTPVQVRELCQGFAKAIPDYRSG